MATVYSLVCWGGRTGRNVTLTLGTPGYFTYSAHGIRTGYPVGLKFYTTGTLPTGLITGITYYAGYRDANSCYLYDTYANAEAGGATGRQTLGGAPSGTHTAESAAMVDYFSAYPLRWGEPGSELCYDGFSSWEAGRYSSASAINEECLELADQFDEYIPYAGNTGSYETRCRVPAAKTTIISKVSGIRTKAFHRGIVGAGYRIMNGYGGFRPTKYDTEINGFSIVGSSGGTGASDISTPPAGYRVINMHMLGTGNSGYGIVLGNSSTALNSLASGCNVGFYFNAYATYLRCCGNTSSKNNYGMQAYPSYESSVQGYFYNNISVGNITQNWSASPTYDGASNNAGLAGEAWGTGKVTIATSDFAGFATNDYKAATFNSPQVEAGISSYGVLPYDIADKVRPDYMNGGAEAYDIGAYEFDHGFGPRPASTTVTFSGVNAGSEIRVYDASGNELAGVESSSASPSLTWTVAVGNQRIVIVHLDYKIKDFTYSNVAGNIIIPVQQERDTWFSNP